MSRLSVAHSNWNDFMVTIDQREKTIEIKIGYWGPGMCGKTTNLKYLYHKLKTNKNHRVSVFNSVSLNGDKMHFFDFYPIVRDQLQGYEINLRLVTLQGSVKHTRNYQEILQEVDGIVFVADSQLIRQQANRTSLKELIDTLALNKIDIRATQLVFQWNKRDLDPHMNSVADVTEMERSLNADFQAKSFSASAITGVNVLEPLKDIINGIVIHQLDKDALTGRPL